MQIIRAYAADRRTDDLFAAMGDGAADIARLVPEVGGRFLSLSPADETGPDQARFRLFDHVARFLRAAAEIQPLVLVFDDLHWADRESLTLLRFFTKASRDARVFVLGTYRDVELTADHPLRYELAEVGAERIVLRGLGRDDVGELIRVTIGTDPPAGLTEAVFGKTTGNPLFVKEVARLLAAQGRLEGATTSAYAIPEGVRDVVRRRLAHLDQDSVQVLGAAAVLGPEFGLDALGGMVVRPVDQVLELLAAPRAARIVAEVPDAVGRYAFAHALLRDVVYEDISPTVRASLHWRAGELIEQKQGGDAHASEIAYHLVNGATGGDPERAADAAIRAGRIALRMYAWDRAADLYTRALDAMELGKAAADRRARTLLELGDARTRAGDLVAAREVYLKAADLASAEGLAPELAHAALGLGGGLVGFEVRLLDERQLDLLARALEMLPSEDSAVRAWITARLSVASSYARSVEARTELSREAIAMSRRIGDRGALSYALSSLSDALAGPKHVEERIAAATEMLDVAVQPATGTARCGVESCAVCLCEPEFALLGRRLRIVANLERGNLAAVDADIDAYARLAEHLRQPLYLWYVPLFRGMRAMMRGELAETERRMEETSTIGMSTSSENASVLIAVQQAGLAFQRGDMTSLESAWRALTAGSQELARLPTLAGMELAARALLGDPSAAVPALHAWLRQGGLTSLPEDSEWLTTPYYLAVGAIRCGDTDSAQHLYEGLAPYEDLVAIDGIAAHAIGPIALILGSLAAFLGRTEEAERHFQKAIVRHTADGSVLFAAHGRLAFARMLAAGGDPRTELRDELALAAAVTFDACGLEDAAAEARALISTRAVPSAPAGEAAFRREGEYWTVAFDGTTTRLRDSKGLRDIATLLSQPGREIASMDLISPDPAAVLGQGDAGEVLDDQARAAYRARIAELQAEIDDADAAPGARERAQEELEALTDQLASAYGLGGRPRKSGDPVERARKAVTERIRDATAKLARENPALGRHLKASLRTGSFCAYTPERPVTWVF